MADSDNGGAPEKIINEKLVIAISSSALFDLEEGDRVFAEEGVEAYSQYQIDQEDVVLPPGEAFELTKKFLSINSMLEDTEAVEVILLSRNSADSGLRVFKSIEHYGLPIQRAAFCSGIEPWRYISAFHCDLFLSSNRDDVKQALAGGVAAATMVGG